MASDEKELLPSIESKDDAVLYVQKRWPTIDPTLVEKIADAVLELQKHKPAVMVTMNTDDPRALVFVEGLINYDWRNLYDASQRLDLTYNTIIKWFTKLKNSGALEPSVVSYYDIKGKSRQREKDEKGKQRNVSILEQPPTTSDNPREKVITSEHNVLTMSSEVEIPETVEIPGTLLLDLFYHALTGNKMGLANVASKILGRGLNVQELMKLLVKKYGEGRGDEMVEEDEEDPEKALERLYKDMIREEISRLRVLRLQQMLTSPFSKANQENSDLIKRMESLEKKYEELKNLLEKSKEEERYRKLEEKVEKALEALEKRRGEEVHPEIKALKEELEKLKSEREKKELIETLKSTVKPASDLDNLLKLQQEMEKIRKEYESKIEELRLKAEESRNKALEEKAAALRDEVQSLKSYIMEIAKDPLKQVTEFADRVAKLEEALKALRKGESPSIESEIKSKAFEVVRDSLTKLVENLPQLTGRGIPPASPSLRLVSIKCPNPECGKDIPLPDPNVSEIVCPHCNQRWQVERR